MSYKASKKINTPEFVGMTIMRIFMILLSVCSLYPILFILFTSMKSRNEFYQSVWALPSRFNIGNYVDAIVSGHIGEYFINSVIITGISLIFILIFSILSAYGLSRLHVPGCELILLLLFVCQMLPQEAMLIPLYVVSSKYGLFQIPYISTIIPYIGWTLAGSIVMLKMFFDTFPQEIVEAARIDGCTELQTMIRVVAPTMKPSICTVMMLAFCGCWGELMWAKQSTLLTDKGITITVGLLRFQGANSTDWGMLTAAVIIIIIPLLIVFCFTQKYLVAGFTGGAVKG